jgi:hypothetical protein
MIWKLFEKSMRARYLQAGLDKKSFRNLDFGYSWNNLVKAYDLRMWYIANSPHDERNITFVHDLERIHNELNYLNMKGE